MVSAPARQAILALALVFICACAGYAGRVMEPRRLFEEGQYDAAVDKLRQLVDRNDNDRLLYLMDLGLVYHAAGKYADAIKTFRAAEDLADRKDFTSVSQEVGSVITNDDARFYKGEDFEKLLINVYLAMDYTLSNQTEDALVECRRVNHKLDVLIAAGNKVGEHNAFAKYLAASLFESQNDWNNAFVDYRLLRKWNPATPFLGGPLLRIADKLKASQEFDEYRRAYPDEKDFRWGKKEGEVIVLVEQGKAPIKVPSLQMRLVPVFQARAYRSRYVVLKDAANPSNQVGSQVLFNIEQAAIKELQQKLAGIVAKKMAGVVAKEAIGAGVGKVTDNKFLGALTSFVLHVSDKADLRSWSTLPATLQIARLKLPAGRHDIELDRVDVSGVKQLGKRWSGVDVRPGKIVFLNYRTPD